MYEFKKCQAPKIFNMTFEKPTDKYPTQFKYKKYSLTSTKHSVSVSWPKIWNEFLTKEEKEIQSHSMLLRKLRLNYLKATMKGNTFK